MQIRLQNISKEFGSAAALHDVSVDIASGELVALLGPSGSGKTTLLRIVAGLEFPSNGRILFNGEDTSSWPVQRRRVGFVFQHYALFKHMTVADNIGFGLSILPRGQRPGKAQIADKVEKLLHLIQLEGYGGRYPSQLSGGQRQRIALARALAIDPSVLLLDEPFGALDARVRKDLRKWLRSIHDETGLTTLFVTHDQDEALELADRLVVLSKGRIEQVGTAETVFDSPETPFVHDFIGETNRLSATVDGERFRVGTLEVPDPSHGLPNGRALLFVRPQHVAVLPHGSGHGSATVAGIRRSGARYRIEAQIYGHDTGVEIELPSIEGITLGQEIGLHLQKWQLFPQAA